MKLEISTIHGVRLASALNAINGVSAKASDEGVQVEFEEKSKNKIKAVLLKNGFDKVDIKDAYPELLESSNIISFRDFLEK